MDPEGTVIREQQAGVAELARPVDGPRSVVAFEDRWDDEEEVTVPDAVSRLTMAELVEEGRRG